MNGDVQDQQDEIMVIESIYSDRRDQFRFFVDGEGDEKKVSGWMDVHHGRLKWPITVRAKDVLDIEVNYLPALRLSFVFPSDYPSCSAPSFSIDAVWMTADIRVRLCDRLMESWEKNKGMPILFTWTQLLEEEALADVLSRGFVDLDAIAADAGKKDPNVMTTDILRLVLRYEERAAQSDFEKEWYDCEVCLELKSGKECLMYVPCGHIFCTSCISGFYRQTLQDSILKTLECLTDGCESSATEMQLRRTLGAEQFERYDRLLLEQALSLMSDVVICPRETCRAPVIVDENSKGTLSTPNLGRCATCSYTFCILCRRAYHGVDRCFVSAELVRKFAEEFPSASSAEQERIKKIFGGPKELKRVFRKQQIAKNVEWVNLNTRMCPNCNVNIEKNGGCDFMYCTSCKSNFMWYGAKQHASGDLERK